MTRWRNRACLLGMLLALIFGATTHSEADQTCGPTPCNFNVKIPFTHLYEFASSGSLSGSSSMPIVRFGLSINDHWVMLRSGSMTGLSCNYEVSVEDTAGKIQWNVTRTLRPGFSYLSSATTGTGSYDFATTWAFGVYNVFQGEDVTFNRILNATSEATFDGSLAGAFCVLEVTGTR